MEEALGNAAVSFATTLTGLVALWLKVLRPLQREVSGIPREIGTAPAVVEQLRSATRTLEDVRARLDRLEEKASAAARLLDDVRARLDRLEEKATRSVTDEEFQAYTATTNKELRTLIEKVGHAAGTIEAWYKQQR